MFLALERLAARKPLVAAIRGTGASGAYLAAMAARTHRGPAARHRRLDRRHLGRSPAAAAPRPPGRERHRIPGRPPQGDGRAVARRDRRRSGAKEQAIVDAFYDAFVARVAHGRQPRRGARPDAGDRRGLARRGGAGRSAWSTRSATSSGRSSWPPAPRASPLATRPCGSGGRSSSAWPGASAPAWPRPSRSRSRLASRTASGPDRGPALALAGRDLAGRRGLRERDQAPRGVPVAAVEAGQQPQDREGGGEAIDKLVRQAGRQGLGVRQPPVEGHVLELEELASG